MIKGKWIKIILLIAALAAAISLLIFTTIKKSHSDHAVTSNVTVNTSSELPDATASHLPRWRGFNLLEKFHVAKNRPFVENDFKWIHELGFNFVRLPMDYRCWIKNNNWNQINEEAFQDIDQAIAWGKKYKIHVCLNFHRAPGYCVNNREKEPVCLWTDPEAQAVCAKHWAFFAKRYKGIPNSELSFNLVNEPKGIGNNTYAKVIRILVEAIRKEDPNRLIIVDGNLALRGNFQIREPVLELIDLGVAQSGRGYYPVKISHYRASWVKGADKYPPPQWPMPYITPYLYGKNKPNLPDVKGPLKVIGTFTEGGELRFHVQTVSNYVRLVIRADGKEIFNKVIKSGPGKGEWKESVYNNKWKIYQNTYDRDYTARIPANTKRIEIEATKGDWLSFSKLEIKQFSSPPKNIVIFPTVSQWGVKPQEIYINSNGNLDELKMKNSLNKIWLKKNCIEPWKKVESKNVGVFVGEFGVFNKTPHDVALKWMKDCLSNWKEAGWGWALWNFRGPLGILDSGRTDVDYKDFHGHKLDRKMLELLQEY